MCACYRYRGPNRERRITFIVDIRYFDGRDETRRRRPNSRNFTAGEDNPAMREIRPLPSRRRRTLLKALDINLQLPFSLHSARIRIDE